MTVFESLFKCLSLLHGAFLSAVLQSTYGQEKLTSIETGDESQREAALITFLARCMSRGLRGLDPGRPSFRDPTLIQVVEIERQAISRTAGLVPVQGFPDVHQSSPSEYPDSR